MRDYRTNKLLQEIPELQDHQYYIYVMENDIGKIKIGRTKNIYQRYQSLCGSNSQGNKITRVCCSPATYLYSIENIMHEKFKKYRIQGTEWFYDDDLKFEDVVKELQLLFSSDDYKRCNSVRKKFCLRK